MSAPVILTHSLHRPQGVLIISDPDLPREVHADALQCCHCQRVMVYRKGAGHHLARCERCNAATCNTPECTGACLPFEKKLDLYEAGKLASL